MEYKNTLNLPKTDFPMKAGLPKAEPLLLKNWDAQDEYGLIRKKTKGKKKYILHDGPPYANGDIHIGHALNKILKDIIIKYKTMQGHDSAYVPGWDCHGLPVEHQLFKELGINKYQIGQLEFRKKAHDYALKFVALQKEQFKRLGVFGDWDNPYLTLNPEYEEAIVKSLLSLVRKDYIYRGLKPVNWCFKCETALAEAEVEYEDHSSPSIYVKFKLEENKIFKEDTYLVIWTTTPWTLIANVAVAVHPEFFYNHYSTDKGHLVIADCREQELSSMGINNIKKIGTFKGKDLEGLTYNHPFGLRKGRIVLADYVSAEEGTGLVHTAPGHGNEDYFTGIKYKLEIIMPVDNQGKFDASAQEFSGMNVLEANKAIIEKLQKLGVLLFDTKISHSYPHCWRCKTPIIFRATKQWFLGIDRHDLRKKLLSAIDKKIEWVPAVGRERISAMVELRPDWCLSRQRYWGVPIPAIICNDCKEELLEAEVIENFAKFAETEGTDSWFKKEVGDFLPANFTCPKCKGNSFSKGTDILDVWFDSGVSSQAVLKKRQDLEFPCALYLEGSDQHRGWFQSSLIPAICIDDKPPFGTVLTHGFVVDGEGRKMSKSQGNVISPQDIIKDYGADILRLWVASSDYNEDIRISPQILSRLSEAYRKVRNTVRFILSNLYDFNPDSAGMGAKDLRVIDKFILWKIQYQLLEPLEDSFNKFEFYKAYKLIYDFCNEDLSMYYLDMLKGRLYTYAADSADRRAAQTALYEILNILVRVMAPILSFTAEEIWQHMPKQGNDKSVLSVHLLEWPDREHYFKQRAGLFDSETVEMKNMDSVFSLIPDITAALEEKRSSGLIGSSFDAKINLLTNNAERYKFLTSRKADLLEIFKVSQLEVKKVEKIDPSFALSAKLPDIAIEALKADGLKCERCWNYSETVGKSQEDSMLCQRCSSVIGGK